MIVLRHKFEVGLNYPVFILMLVHAILTSSVADVPCPNPQCICQKTTVTCTNMFYIPPLPSKTKGLVFRNNFLPSISRNTFSNITNLKLKTLLLSRCEIQNITADALYNFNSTLEILDMSGNTGIDKQQLSSSLMPLRSIKVLSLNQINMGNHLDSNFFKGMNGSDLASIHLQDNNFNNIGDQAFQVFQHLKRLDFSHNKINFAEFSGLIPLEVLKLSFNRLFDIPDFCVNGSSKFPKMNLLKLDNNFIDTRLKASLSCLTSLKELHLDGNQIRYLDDNVFSQFKRLNRLYLQSMRLEYISSFAFNNSNLKSLYLRGCCIKFTSSNFDYANLFQWCPNLQKLVLDSNNMRNVNATSLMSMVSPLKKLMYLSLQGMKLKYFPAEFFKPLVSLRHLDLTSNLISEWPRTLFSNVSNLRTLLMANNKIKVIKKEHFPSALMKNLTKLDLSDNPFDCSCENLWLRKWMNNILHQKPNIFSNNYPKSYKCTTPTSLEGTLLMTYNPTDEDCRTWGHVLMDIIITSSAVCFIFACAAVVYIQRWNIRYLLHEISMRRKKYTLLKDKDFQYDLYIAYSDKDRSWVRNELWRELQQEKGLKLYIRDKSEDPGVARCDSIVNNMYCSRKVILVISPSFMTCQWCQYQLQVAQDGAVHVGSEWLIPIILGDLNIRHVTKSLHMLLNYGNGITWSDEEDGRRLFWAKLLASIEDSVNLNNVIEDDSLIAT
ncbi:hypothetical protein CHS0354_006497 [Potamilus streckersoni]|uniref:TIR domain-containing protein n=1 Tax=Potamilus streckersoni TaxID=2493646 RepID=A0AAE0RLN2_9BIVA|nr:hypothetical protein CHS0354_006497 [Potamilus streckersoni]